MNYHVEYHIFPALAYHALSGLHDEVEDNLVAPLPRVAVHREIVSTLAAQRRAPTYEIPDRRVRDELEVDHPPTHVGEELWVREHDADRVDPASATALVVDAVRRVDTDDRPLTVHHSSDDEYAVTEGICTHGQAHLADRLAIDCPKHNVPFDIRTGAPVRRPVKEPIAIHDVEVINGCLVSRLGASAPEGSGS